jgi:hypothetical protein
MATIAKIRMGAVDSLILFNVTDLGGTVGGVELDYTPTIFQVEIDQVLLPVRVVKTKEEVSLTMALAQFQMSLVSAAFGYPTSNITTVAAGTLTTATPPTVTVVGTPGAITYTYDVVAFSSNGDGIPSTTGTTATGNAALSLTNLNRLTWAAVAGAAGYKIVRTVGGATQGVIATFQVPSVLTLDDTGLVATPYTPSIVNPATPTVDTSYFGTQPGIPQGPLDWSVPKNDGSGLHIRGHFWQCASFKAIKLNFDKAKPTELNKVSFMALGDLTQPVGQQMGWLNEER